MVEMETACLSEWKSKRRFIGGDCNVSDEEDDDGDKSSSDGDYLPN